MGMTFREQFFKLTQEPGPEDLRSLAERLSGARWAQGSIVTPDPFVIVWSAKGRERMMEVVDVIKKTRPGLLEKDARPFGNFAYLRYLWHFRKATRELRPPSLSTREEAALVAMAVVIVQRPEALRVFSTFES